MDQMLLVFGCGNVSIVLSVVVVVVVVIFLFDIWTLIYSLRHFIDAALPQLILHM